MQKPRQPADEDGSYAQWHRNGIRSVDDMVCVWTYGMDKWLRRDVAYGVIIMLVKS